MPRLTRTEASDICQQAGINPTTDFHQLYSDQVDSLVAAAQRRGYRKAPSAPGSTGRMFYQYIQRTLTPRPMRGWKAR